jgi:hypothetical protein
MWKRVFKSASVVTGLTVGWLACASLASAAVSVPINPLADAFVATGSGTDQRGNNFGAAGALEVSANGLANGEFQSVMKFDSSSAKSAFDAAYGAGNWTIQSASLQLTASSPNNNLTFFNGSAAGSFNVSLMQNASWIEGTGKPNLPTTNGITYNSLPSFLGPSDQALGAFGFNGATSGANTYTLALTSGLTSDVSVGGLVSLRLLAADSNISYLFNSNNFTTASARPVLTLTAIPEPTGVSAMIVGAAAFMMQRRSRR